MIPNGFTALPPKAKAYRVSKTYLLRPEPLDPEGVLRFLVVALVLGYVEQCYFNIRFQRSSQPLNRCRFHRCEVHDDDDTSR